MSQRENMISRFNCDSTLLTFSFSLTSPIIKLYNKLGKFNFSELFKLYRFNSHTSKRCMIFGLNLAIWCATSEPIEPPAPVTRTDFP